MAVSVCACHAVNAPAEASLTVMAWGTRLSRRVAAGSSGASASSAQQTSGTQAWQAAVSGRPRKTARDIADAHLAGVSLVARPFARHHHPVRKQPAAARPPGTL